MKKQLTLKKLSLFVLTALLFVLLSLAFAFTGTARAYADGDGQPCRDGQHTLGDIFVVEKQTCVSHGVGVRYCQECGLSFNVVIPADGISHKVDASGHCSECGAEHVDYVITENLPDKDYVEVGQVEESELKSITIPKKVTTKGQEKEVHVADKAFEGNETIESVIIEGTPEIGAEAFKDCKNLKTVTMADGTQNIAADAFVGTPFYNGLLAAAKTADENASAENKGQLQPISIPISNGNGSYLLKVVDPTTIKTETSGGSAEPEPEPEPAPSRPRRNAANETAEAPKTFTYKVASGTKVIAEKAFADLANLVEVTLNPDLLTVGANAFDGCSALKTIYIAKAAESEQPVSDKSFANVAGLAPYNTIYYWGEPQVDENKKDTIFKALANVIRYYSATEPTDNTHTYWHFVGEGTVQLPTIWNKAVEIALDTSHCTTRFRKGEAFSSEGLVVKVRYDNETQLKEVKNFKIDSSAYNATKVTEAGKPYTITVSYLTYLTATYDVTVDDAYTITINYGYEGQATKTELIFVQDGFTLPAAPKREGYKFLGWKVGDAQELMQAGEKFTPTADTTVTAQWEKLYKVTAIAPNATTTLPTGTYYASSTEVTFSVTPANGYKLVSVKNGNATLTAQDGKYSVTVGKEDIEIKVETAAVTVTATTTDGIAPQVSYNNAHDTATITLTTPTKEGYCFDGWTVKVGSAAPAALDGNTYSLKLANSDVTVTFTAKWTEMLITSASVTLQLNENTLTLVATVTANGFTLENIAGVKLQLGDGTPIQGSAAEATDGFTLTYTLTALTAKADGYAIKFVLELTKETKDVYHNGTITCGEGHHDFSGNRYALADGKLTVTAPLIVTFDVGGHGTAPAPQSVFAGETLNLDDITEPTATGYVFLYWYTLEGTTETQFDLTTPVTEEMTIYAKMGDEVTASVSIKDYAEAQTPKWNNDTKYTDLQLDKYILVQVKDGGGNSGKYYTNGYNWRIYQSENPNLTFTAANGAKIVTIKVTYTKDDSHGILLNAEGEEYKSNAKLEVNAPSYTFTIGNDTEGGTGGKVRITNLEVTYGVVLTDADRIQMAYDYLNANHGTIDTQYPQAVENSQLPQERNGATLTWAVKDAATHTAYITIENNVLNITLPTEDKEVTLQVTVSCGTAETKILEIKITIIAPINYGTAEAPLTVTQALAIADRVCTEDGMWTEQVVYVKGFVLSTPTSGSYFGSFELGATDSAEGDKILVYSANKNNNVNMIAQHDEVVLYGLITNYNGTIEFSRKQNEDASTYTEVLLHSRTIGQSTIKVEADQATVVGISDNETKANDSEVEFTVQLDAGRRLESVMVYNEIITADDNGKYSFTVAGDTTIKVETEDVNAPKKESIEYDSSAMSYGNAHEVGTVTLDGGFTIVFDKGSNNNNPPKYYTDGKAVRVYGNNTITVSSGDSGYKIAKITFTFVSVSNNNKSFTADKGTLSEDLTTWTGEETSVKFTLDGGSGQRRFQKITITYLVPTEPEEPKLEYSVESVVFADAESGSEFSLTFALSVEGQTDIPNATATLAIGEKTFNGTVGGNSVSFTIDPADLTNGLEMKLTLDGIAPKEGEITCTGSATVNGKIYSAEYTDNTLKLKVEEKQPEPEFSFSVESITLGESEGKLTISFKVKVTQGEIGDKKAQLTINGEPVDSPKTANGNEFTFTVTPNEAWGDTWELKFTIGGKTPTALPDPADKSTDIGNKSYTLTKSAEGALQITVTTKEEPVESGSFTITLNSSDDLYKANQSKQTYGKYSWTAKSADEKRTFSGVLNAAASASGSALSKATLQFSYQTDKKAYAYLLNTTEMPAPISKVTIVCRNGSSKKIADWYLKTSTVAYVAPENNDRQPDVSAGTTYGPTATPYDSSTMQTISWNVTGNDKFFVLYIKEVESGDPGTALVESITIEYGGKSTGGGTDPTPTPGGGGTEPSGGEESGQETVLYELPSSQGKDTSSSGYNSVGSVTAGGVNWNVRANCSMDPWRFGGSSSNLTDDTPRTLTSVNTIKGKVARIELEIGTISSSNITISSVQLTVYTYVGEQKTTISTLTENYENTKVTFQAGEADWTNCYYEFKFNISISGTSTAYFTISTLKFFGVKIEGAGSDVKTEETKITLTKDNLGVTSYSDNETEKEIDSVKFGYVQFMVNGSDIQAKGGSGELYNTKAFNGYITKIVINYSTSRTTQNKASVQCAFATHSNPTGGTSTALGSNKSITFTADIADQYTYFHLSFNTNAHYISSIEITYEKIVSSDQGMEGPTMASYTANMNNGNVESDGLWLALAVGGSALLLVSSLAVVLLLRKHN